jgi:small acid-soluble spore protein H (minor)
LNIDRARQIVESQGVIEVTYDGSPVWIENIRNDNAEVTYLGTRRREEVPINVLMEGGNS